MDALFEISLPSHAYNTAALAANGGMAEAPAQRAIRKWKAAKAIAKKGHAALAVGVAASALDRRNGARNLGLLQQKYDRGDD